MFRLVGIMLVSLMVALATRTAAAQDYRPHVIIALESAETALADLEYIMSFTSEEEQKQLSVLNEYLDIFLIGIDRAKPMRIDIVMGGKVDRYISAFPVSKLPEFRDNNLFDLGIDSRIKPPFTNVYVLTGDVYEGFMRMIDSYAIFAETLDEVPQKMPNPTEEITPLLENTQIGLWGRNQEEGQPERRKLFESDRKGMVDALTPMEEETADDFAVRKAAYEAYLDEFERLYVEAKELKLRGSVNPDQQNTTVDVQATPLPETTFATSLESVGQQPSRFAAIERVENSILSGRLNLSLDEMRQKYLVNLLDAMRTRTKNKADASADFTAAQKTARKKMADMLHDVAAATVRAGLGDAFVEAHSNESGKNTLLFGSRLVDGNKVLDILKLVPEAAPDESVAMDVAKAGDVAIHKVTISEEQHAEIVDFFGSTEIFVGTHPDVVWVGAGENAQQELTEAIEKAANGSSEADTSRFLSAYAKMLPWLQLRDALSPEEGETQIRQLALDAFEQGQDTMDLYLQRDGDQAVGQVVANPGIMRFAGKFLADFSKENLDE